MTADSAAVTAAVDTLLTLAPPQRRREVESLRSRTRQRRLRVLVAGEAKRGKSTLLNRILDRDVLPVGVLPVTAVATTVRVTAHTEEHIIVHFTDGHDEQHPVTALSGFVSEHENPNNQRRVASVDVLLTRSAVGSEGVELVDTPGTGSVFEHNTDAARAAYGSLDAVIVVLGADPPVSASEVELLSSVAALAVRTFVLVNKTDRLDPDELAQTIAFTNRVISAAGVDAHARPMSARHRDHGLTEFLATFRAYLHSDGENDAVRAIAGHAARLAGQLRDETRLTLAASKSTSTWHRDRVERFASRIDALTAQTSQLHDSLDVARLRATRELTAQATASIRRISTDAQDAAEDGFDADTAAGTAAREAAGRDRAVASIVSAVEKWRTSHALELGRQLQELTSTLNREIDQQIESLRDAATNLLGVELSQPSQGVRLLASRAFWYATDPPVTWELPGTQLTRNHGPGATHRARRRLAAEVARLTDQQLGRARADLQQRYSETLRNLAGQLRTRHAQVLEQMKHALTTAARLASIDTSGASIERARLTTHETALGVVRTDLTRLAAPSSPEAAECGPRAGERRAP